MTMAQDYVDDGSSMGNLHFLYGHCPEYALSMA